MTIKFCGAAGQVTGSCHLITLDDGYKILLDCGLYQGHDDDMADFNRTWRFDPKEIDCMILSHAHIDHTGRLPKLVKDGYQGIVHCTHATRSLCSIMLLDSAYIQERDAAYENKKRKKKGKKGKNVEPLYKSQDVHNTMRRFMTYGYEQWIRIHKDVDLYFTDAGHILGSASVTLRIKRADGREEYLGFTGDIGRPNRPILRDPQEMPPAHYVISESTYGNRLHDEAPMETERFLNILIETCVKKRGKLIIPAFSIGRTQEIVYMMDQLESAGRLPKIPVYVDSPLAVNATEIYGSHSECYDDDLSTYLLSDDNPFGFKELKYIHRVDQSKQLNASKEPAVIISASGMMNAGRIRHHLRNNLADPNNTLLIVGYCAPHTLGGILRNGVEEVKLFGEMIPVLLNIEVMDSFSAHGDQQEMRNFLMPHLRHCKALYLVHGESTAQQVFAEVLGEDGFKNVEIPRLGQTYEMG